MQIRTILFITLLISWSSTSALDWPRFRGENIDGVSQETGLLSSWPEGGPKLLWKIDNVGIGYSSVAVAGGKIYTQGDLNGIEHILALSEKDGSLLWAVQPAPVAAAIESKVAKEFARLDTNKDGVVDEVESLEIKMALRIPVDSATESDIEKTASERAGRFIGSFDDNGDGQLGVGEIPAVLDKEMRNRLDSTSRDRRAFPDIARSRAENTIADLDKNKDNLISRDEATGTVLNWQFGQIDDKPPGARKGDEQLTFDELKSFFGRVERGRDGILNESELADYFARFHPGRDGIIYPRDLKIHLGGYRHDQGDGPRATPTVVGNRIYTEGGLGDVTCLEAETGKTIWHINLVEQLKGVGAGWGYSESLLVVDNKVIVTPGGNWNGGIVAALDVNTGREVWRSDRRDGAHYVSPLLAEIGGKRQVVQFSGKGVFGLDLETGKQLWDYSPSANGIATVATPIVEHNYVLSSSAYGKGAGLVEIVNQDNGTQAAREIWFRKSLQNHHGGIIKVGDHVYGSSNGSFVCLNFKTGEIAWQDRTVRKGALVYAEGHFYHLEEGHSMVLFEANPAQLIEKGRFPVENLGKPSWAHPVVANGKLYIRNLNTLSCFDISK